MLISIYLRLMQCTHVRHNNMKDRELLIKRNKKLKKLSNNSKINALSKLPNIILLILIKEHYNSLFNKNKITTLFFYSI